MLNITFFWCVIVDVHISSKSWIIVLILDWGGIFLLPNVCIQMEKRLHLLYLNTKKKLPLQLLMDKSRIIQQLTNSMIFSSLELRIKYLKCSHNTSVVTWFWMRTPITFCVIDCPKRKIEVCYCSIANKPQVQAWNN